MIINTFYKISTEESNYIAVAKKYGWKETDALTAVEFARNWCQKEVIEKRLADEFYSFSLAELQALSAKISEDTKALASGAVAQVDEASGQ